MAYTGYKVLKAPIDQIETLMNDLIGDGWQPLGAPTLTYPNSNMVYQAVVQGTPDGGGGSGPVTIVVNDITDATDTGKAVLLADDSAAARSAIGAGTGNSNLALGTTGSTAKAGNYAPTAAEVLGVLPAALTAAQAAATPSIRALGTTATTALAGNTALLAIGTTATTAKAGNYQPTWAQVTSKPAVIAAGADAAAARTSIGAGTGNSNLAVATTPPAALAAAAAVGTGSTAARADHAHALPTAAQVGASPTGHNHAVTADAASGLEAAANIQALAVALSTRIKVLEDEVP